MKKVSDRIEKALLSISMGAPRSFQKNFSHPWTRMRDRLPSVANHTAVARRAEANDVFVSGDGPWRFSDFQHCRLEFPSWWRIDIVLRPKDCVPVRELSDSRRLSVLSFPPCVLPHYTLYTFQQVYLGTKRPYLVPSTNHNTSMPTHRSTADKGETLSVKTIADSKIWPSLFLQFSFTSIEDHRWKGFAKKAAMGDHELSPRGIHSEVKSTMNRSIGQNFVRETVTKWSRECLGSGAEGHGGSHICSSTWQTSAREAAARMNRK